MLTLSNFIKITLLTMTLLVLTGCGSKSTTDTNTTTQSAEGNVTVEGTDDNQSLESNTTTPPENNETRPEHNTSTPQDSIAPTLTLNGEPGITLDQNAPYAELGATAVDAVDGNVSVTISGNVDTSTVGSYTVTYSAQDGAGNEANTTRTITVIDVTPPVITLNGEANITLEQNAVYIELGATALDAVDGNVSVNISGDVNTSVVGVYVITYTTTDSSGNSASVSRSVNVNSNVPKLKSLVLSTEKTKVIVEKNQAIHIYQDKNIPFKVMGLYSDGHSEEVTDQVTWTGLESAKQILADFFIATAGVYTFKGSLDGVESNEVSVEVVNDTSLIQYDISYSSSKYTPDEISINVTTIDAPKEDISFTITIDENDKAAFPYHVNNIMKQSHTFEFKKGVVDSDQFTTIKILDTNMTTPVTVVTHPMQSKDVNYANIDLEDIVLSRVPDFTLDAPSLQERRGAIRGVTIKFEVWSKQYGLKYVLVNPPKGMKITGGADEGMGGRDGRKIQWEVPMDAIEGKIYDITVKATDFRVNGKEKTITFPIKVPKTKPIQTKLVNNELIVTDKSSNLYGMKMKGHSGEDV